MVFYRRVAVRFEYFHGTFYRAFGDGRVVGSSGGPFRMAGVSDPADFGLGVCAVLFAKQRVYDAAVSGTKIQQAMRGISGGDFDHCVHLHEDFRAAVCGERGAGARGRMVAVEDGDCARDCDGNLYDCGRAGGGDLHGHGADANFDNGRGGADSDWPASGGRICAPADDCAAELFPYDKTSDGFGVSMDGNIFWRPDFGNLVLVHGPGDCATRAFSAG